MSRTNQNLKNLALTALFAALVVGLQILGGIPIGPFSITLTLVPIVVGAILLGWQYGLALGVIFGVIVSILSITGKDPGGFMVFQANAFLGWTVCVLKGAAAGVLPALLYKFFSKVKCAPHVFMALSGAFLFLSGFAVGKLLSFDAAWKTVLLAVLFALLAAGYLLIARLALSSGNSAVYLAAMSAPVANTGIFIIGMLLFFKDVLASWAGGTNLILYVLSGIVGINFVIEFAVAIVLSPAIATIVKRASKEK